MQCSMCGSPATRRSPASDSAWSSQCIGPCQDRQKCACQRHCLLHTQYREFQAIHLLQAFQEELLAACGRSHTLADAEDALTAVAAAAPPSWSLDLISGLRRLQGHATM